MTTPNEVKALCELERIYLAPLCCTDPNEGRLWCEHDVWPLDDCDENACGVPYVRADIVAAKDALIESLSARNAEMVEALAHARQVLAVYQPEGAPTFYMEALWKAEAALDTPSKQLGEAK